MRCFVDASLIFDCGGDDFRTQVTFVSARDHLPGLEEQGESRGHWNQNSAWYSIKEQDRNIFAFEVQTSDYGYNSGRSYYFGTRSKEERGMWVSKMQDTITASKLKRQAEENSRWTLAQIRCKRFYDSDLLQGCVAFLIFGNFVANVAQSELQPTPGSSADSSFTSVDTFFTGNLNSRSSHYSVTVDNRISFWTEQRLSKFSQNYEGRKMTAPFFSYFRFGTVCESVRQLVLAVFLRRVVGEILRLVSSLTRLSLTDLFFSMISRSASILLLW
jgi:hypothetical protein